MIIFISFLALENANYEQISLSTRRRHPLTCKVNIVFCGTGLLCRHVLIAIHFAIVTDDLVWTRYCRYIIDNVGWIALVLIKGIA